MWDAVNGNVNNPYFIIREQHEFALQAIQKGARNIIAVADVANGKSLYLAGLAAKQMAKGSRVFWLQDDAENIAAEIDYLCSLDCEVTIVIENYSRRLNEIKQIQFKRSDQLTLLLSAKSGAHEAYQHDLLQIIDGVLTVDVSLDVLSDAELDSLDLILTTYKLWGERDAWSPHKKRKFLEEDCDRQLSSVLLEIVKSPSVQLRFQALFSAFQGNSALADVMVAASVLKLLGFNSPKAYIISELLDNSYLYSLDFKRNPTANELLSTGNGNLIPRSSVLAKHGLTSFTDSRVLVDRLIKIAHNAHDRGQDSELFFGIYRELVTFSTLQAMLPEKGKRDALIRFYEAIKNLRSAQNHPHFWLQYAIARLASDRPDDLAAAKLFLDTAYAHAQKRQNYHTRHFDNVKARYLIQHAKNVPEISTAMLEFVDGHALLLKQCRSDHSEAPYKVAKNYLSFYNEKKPQLQGKNLEVFQKFVKQILDYIPKLPEHVRTLTPVRYCKSDLDSILRDIESVANK